MTAPYVMAIRVSDLFADAAYQRDAEPSRVRKMAADFDPRLLGVIDVSKRPNGRYAILDGQHRHALVREVRGSDEPIVCQVYEGLTVDEEARLFHEINVRRKALNFWDRWKARRAAGDQQVALIEQVLELHGLRVNPSAVDGNVMATAALEVIVNDIGDQYLLNEVVATLIATFGRSRDAFQGPIMQGLAYVLASYRPDELDRDRLIRQLSELPVKQLRARAQGMREAHRGTLARLVGAVIVDQYNRGAGRRAEAFLSRVPAGSVVAIRKRWLERAESKTAAPADAPKPEPPTDEPPACAGCGHSRADHMVLMPQCAATRCTCLRYRPVEMAKAG